MTGLDISPEHLAAEKSVVIEEFKQRYLNQPYGDASMMLRKLAYTRHPYRWATIGRTPDHIAGTTLDEVRSFYRTHYRPSGAILSISADLDEERMIALAEKWFGPIADRPQTVGAPPAEPPQTAPRRRTVERDVPAAALWIAFHMGPRTSRDFYLGDFASDLLASGDSSRLYTRLVKERRLFASVNAYITGDVDPGLFVLTGHLLPGTTPQQAEKALLGEVRDLAENPPGDYECEKVKNKFEANTLFGEINVMNKAMNLGFYEMLGDIGLVNRETAIYRSIAPDEISDFCRRTFRPENSSTLLYEPCK